MNTEHYIAQANYVIGRLEVRSEAHIRLGDYGLWPASVLIAGLRDYINVLTAALEAEKARPVQASEPAGPVADLGPSGGDALPVSVGKALPEEAAPAPKAKVKG